MDISRGNIYGADGRPLPSAQLLETARLYCGGEVMLAFSGKDSLAAWLWLRENGFKIHPFSYISFPGFHVREEYLEYCEDFFGQKIHRVLEPDVYHDLRHFRFQSPDRIPVLRSFVFPRSDYDDADAERVLANRLGLPENYLVAVGYRSADGLGRRSFIRKNGAIIIKKRHIWFAIHDWKNRDVMDIINKYQVKLSNEYEIFGSTSDAFDALTLRLLYHNYRDEYDNLKRLYPLIGVLPIRYFYVR